MAEFRARGSVVHLETAMPAVATQTGWSWLQDLREIEALAEASNVDFKQLSGFSSISDFTGKYMYSYDVQKKSNNDYAGSLFSYNCFSCNC